MHVWKRRARRDDGLPVGKGGPAEAFADVDPLQKSLLEDLRAGAEALAFVPPGPAEAEAPQTFASGGLILDFGAHTATLNGATVHLTPTEWRLLAELARHLGRVVPHEELLKAVWGPNYGGEHHYLRVFANQIRRKIEADPQQPAFIKTVRSGGYIFSAKVTTSAPGASQPSSRWVSTASIVVFGSR